MGNRKNLREEFGNIDVYLFDQLLKGRLESRNRVLDMGCGGGRNLFWLMRNGFEVFGVDPNPEAIRTVKMLAAQFAPALPEDNFRVGTAENNPFEQDHFDVLIMNAVLHFAENDTHFEGMLQGAWKSLRPGGLFFARLASDIGINDLLQPLGQGRFALPDGTTRYLVNHKKLLEFTEKLGGTLLDPIKTTNVQNLRCMSTWVLEKW